MDESHLRELLRELHTELERPESVREDTRELLAEIRAEIAAFLAESKSANRRAPSQFRERLEGATAVFEATHPQLAGMISRTLDALAKLGI